MTNEYNAPSHVPITHLGFYNHILGFGKRKIENKNCSLVIGQEREKLFLMLSRKFLVRVILES